MNRALLSIVVAFTGAGCGPNPWDEVLKRPVCDTLDTDPECPDLLGGSSGGTAWTTGGVMTTTFDPGSGGANGDASGGSGDGASPPGDADAGLSATLTVSPAQVFEVMDVDVALAWTGPVETVDLYDGDVPLLLGASPAAALHTLKVTSDDSPGDGKHELCAVAHAVDGRTLRTCAELEINVMGGGEEYWKQPLENTVSAFTSAAMLGDDVVVAGYLMPKGDVPKLAVVVFDGLTGEPSEPILFETITWSGEASGPALVVDPGGSIYVTATVPFGQTTRRAFYRLNAETLESYFGARYSDLDIDATALAVCQGQVVVVGSVRTNENPARYDLRVSWLSKESGHELASATFAAPMLEDDKNWLSERAYGVACVGDEVVVVGTRGIKPNITALEHVRTVVLRYAASNAAPAVWTSPGDVLAEDAALAVAPTKDGGFALTGWTRNKFGTVRQVLTRRFAPGGSPVWPPRPELTADEDATGRAIAEDLEGKLIIAATRKQYLQDLNAWIFAAPDLVKPRTWEKVYNGTSNGPDEAFGLVLDGWGYPFAAGTEFEALQVRAFALRLYP
jgi:hypothetical protein